MSILFFNMERFNLEENRNTQTDSTAHVVLAEIYQNRRKSARTLVVLKRYLLYLSSVINSLIIKIYGKDNR